MQKISLVLCNRVTDAICAIESAPTVRKATVYVDPKTIVRLTRRVKPTSRDRRQEFVLTIGEPNVEERERIAVRKRSKEPLPQGVVIHHFPAKRKKR